MRELTILSEVPNWIRLPQFLEGASQYHGGIDDIVLRLIDFESLDDEPREVEDSSLLLRWMLDLYAVISESREYCCTLQVSGDYFFDYTTDMPGLIYHVVLHEETPFHIDAVEWLPDSVVPYPSLRFETTQQSLCKWLACMECENSDPSFIVTDYFEIIGVVAPIRQRQDLIIHDYFGTSVLEHCFKNERMFFFVASRADHHGSVVVVTHKRNAEWMDAILRRTLDPANKK